MNTNAHKIKPDYKFISTLVLTILGIIISFFFYLLSKETRSFRYEIISSIAFLNSPMLMPQPQQETPSRHYVIKPDLQLLYKNKRIENAYYTLIQLKNTGSVPIKTSDFESDIQIKFDKDVKIYESLLLDREPSSLKTNIYTVNNKAIITPTLFNPGDYLIIGILSSNSSQKPAVTARINGIKSIEGRVMSSKQAEKYLGALFLFMAIVIGWIYVTIGYGIQYKIKVSNKTLVNVSRIEAIIIFIFLGLILSILTAEAFNDFEVDLLRNQKPIIIFFLVLSVEMSMVILIKRIKYDFTPEALYKKAAHYALNGNEEDALSNLARAIKRDMSYKEKARGDDYFKQLWKNKDFEHLTD